MNLPRLPESLAANRLTTAVRRARAAGAPLIDLTETNPTTAGIPYAQDLLAPLASPEGLRYDPSPFGTRAAREAVAGDYARKGLDVDPDRIVLTASTSEAYSLLFKLLCRSSGDEVLVPSPSYPLFDHLTRLDGVRAEPYRLDYHGRWSLDVAAVKDAWSDATRALLAVSPNNPTGSVLTAAELRALDAVCAERGAAVIVDEVFADYPLGTASCTTANDNPQALTVRLGGLSKSAGLPQVKLGWMALAGPAALVDEARAGLELICDTYLSVATPVQVAAPALIAGGARVRSEILARVRRNHDSLRMAVNAHPALDALEAAGGWSAVLRVPATRSEEDLVVALLEEAHVLVHPGFFFDFPSEAFLVVGLLAEPALFDEGVARVLEHVS